MRPQLKRQDEEQSDLPRIVIFAESGPLAGDLAACLAGKFNIDRVTNTQDALGSLGAGSRALLVFGEDDQELRADRRALVSQALRERCRVLVLGSGGLGLEPELSNQVVFLPPLPSPQVLFDSLENLTGPQNLNS